MILERDFLRIANVALIGAVGLAGCAQLGVVQGSPEKKAPAQVIKADGRATDPLTSLEQELTKVHSERVVVSTALLKSLVKNERVQQTQCKYISGQLEAIKNIDLEEAEESR